MTETLSLSLLPLYVRTPHFFANPLVDAVRTVCVIAAVLLVAAIVRVLIEQRRRGLLKDGQAARFTGLGMLVVSVAYTEIIVQGTAMTWRLPINLLGVAFSAYGITAMRRGQKRK